MKRTPDIEPWLKKVLDRADKYIDDPEALKAVRKFILNPKNRDRWVPVKIKVDAFKTRFLEPIKMKKSFEVMG